MHLYGVRVYLLLPKQEVTSGVSESRLENVTQRIECGSRLTHSDAVLIIVSTVVLSE